MAEPTTEDAAPAYDGPLPAVSNLNRPHWDGLREHRLLAPRCDDCGHVWLPPGPWCVACWSRSTSWVELAGTGTIASWVRFHQRYYRSAAFAVPYVVAEVTLAEGPRVTARLVEGTEPAVGLAVVASYDDVSPELTLLRFRPAG